MTGTSIVKQFFSKQFIIFVLTGGIAALANFVSRILLNQYLSFSSSVIIAYVVGMVVAYILFRTLVFDTKQLSLKKSVSFFCVVNALGILQTYLISMVLYYWMFPYVSFNYHPDTFAHLIGIMIPAFTSFVGHKYLTFNNG